MKAGEGGGENLFKMCGSEWMFRLCLYFPCSVQIGMYTVTFQCDTLSDRVRRVCQSVDLVRAIKTRVTVIEFSKL